MLDGKKNYAPVMLLVMAGLAGVVWVSACGDGGTTPAVPDPPSPTTVTITPATAQLTALGETARFTAEVRDQNGQVMAGVPLAWTSSDASVAAVDASGQVTAAANGAATITAAAGSASGSAAVTVAQEASVVTVSPDGGTLSALGDTVRLSAEAMDVNGSAIANAAFAWTSSDTAVATVDEDGVVTAVGNGAAMIAAAAGSASGSAAVTVAQEASVVRVSPDRGRLSALGDTVRLSAEAMDANGNAVANAAFAWTSSDTAVATVDENGVVTAVRNGAATITATTGSASGGAALTVAQKVAAVAVTPTTDTLVTGEKLHLSAEAADGNGHAVAGAGFWWASSNTSVAVVDRSGLVTGTGAGVADITATSSFVSGRARMVVLNPPAMTLTVHSVPAEENSSRRAVNPEELVLWPGEWLRADTRIEGAKRVATWKASDPGIVAVHVGRDPNNRPLRSGDDVAIEVIGFGETVLTATYGRSEVSVKVGAPTPRMMERSLVDRKDDVSGPQIHAVYAVASDDEDRELDRHGRVGWSLMATVDWLYDKLGRRLRVDTYEGVVDVTFLRLRETAAQMEDRNVRALRDAVRAKAWYSDEKTYAVYYLGPTGNAGGVKIGNFATVFSDSRGLDRPHYVVARQPDFLGALENTMAHELFHTMGVVHEQCATNPAANGSSHVGDYDHDLMAVRRRRGRMLTEIDVGNDDYYDHDIPNCRDAADSPLWMDPPPS